MRKLDTRLAATVSYRCEPSQFGVSPIFSKRHDTPAGKLGLVSTTCLVIASMIGAGVFVSSGFALASLGSPQWVLIAWAIGAVVAVCGAISYGALVRDLCESGGEYLFLSRRIHPLVGFLAGWISLVAGFTGAIAFAATTLATYIVPVVPYASERAIAIGVVLLCAVQHCIGLRAGATWQTIVVVGKVVALVGIAFVGIALLGRGGGSMEVVPAATPSLGVLASSLTWIALAFSGFNAAVYVAGEVDDAPRTVPRAMLIGTLIVAVLYLALNAVFVYAGPMDQLAGQGDIAAVAMELLGGQRLANVCRAVIAVALFTSVSANLMAGPRVYDRMAADGLFPIRAMQPGEVPRLAIIVQAVLACIVICVASLKEQLDYLGVLLSISAAMAVGSLFVPRAGSKTRLTPITAIAAGVFTVASLVFAGFALKHNYDSLGSVWKAVLATLVSGVVFYSVMSWWKSRERR